MIVAFSHKYWFGIRESYAVHYNFAIFETQRNKLDDKKLNFFFEYWDTFKYLTSKFNPQTAKDKNITDL